MKLTFLLTILLLTTLTACQSAHYSSPLTSVNDARETMFNEFNWSQYQEVYTPDDWPEALTAKVIHPNTSLINLPVMLLVHGGGWQRRSSDDMDAIAKFWAERGFITVNISYRFAPEYQFPAQLHDVQQAMHWISKQRNDWNALNSPTLAFGFSSGAHLVSLMANVAGQDSSLDHPHGGRITRPDLVVLGGLPSDLRKWESGRLIEDFLGGKQADLPDIYRIASPITHVHTEAPATFLFHGTMDRLVPIDHATDYHQALLDAQVDVELKSLSLRGHITSFIFRGSAMQAAEKFVNRQLENVPFSHAIGVE